MKWFRPWWFPQRSAPQPPARWAGPAAFYDWTDADIAAISAAIRKKNGQPDAPGWQPIARTALNTMRGGSAVELVARAIEASMNPGHDPDRPIGGSHYMNGMPHWCMWVEYARPAVEEIAGRHHAPVPFNAVEELNSFEAEHGGGK